jgi:putative addiction module component (TIGR02574 family)
MSVGSEAVLREALTLSSRERAEVAAELLASLDEPEVDDAEATRAAWAEELERRARRALAGEDPGEPWQALQERLRNKRAQ